MMNVQSHLMYVQCTLIIHMSLLFCDREYPCDHVAMLNLALLNVGSPRTQTHETAVQLLHLLDTRFFQEPIFYTESAADDMNHSPLPLNDIFLSVSYCHAQMCLSEQLAKLHPEITLDMFSGELLAYVYLYN